ncbi:MAG: Ig-like domain-containing protein [Bacillota bacterium]|nr:Ig-like domain-containing protein [Bacillota bacterium]
MKKLAYFLVVFCLIMLSIVPLSSAEEITKSNADVLINVGEKYTLEAVLNYMIEKQLPLNILVNWETSDAKIATVKNGVVSGIKEGGVIIKATATNEGKTYQAQAKVYVCSTVTGVVLNKDAVELKVGQTDRLVETVLPDSAVLKTVTWTSENKNVVTVTNGTIKGIGEGYAYVFATTSDGAYVAKCGVRVISTVSSILLKEHYLTKYVGEEFNLEYTLSPSDAFLKDVKWTPSNTKVLSVTTVGKLKALSEGTVTVKAETVDGKHTDECTINVKGMVQGITLNKNDLEIIKGNKEVIAAVVYPDNAIQKGVTWKSDNPKIATVVDGLITGVEDGETVITATTLDGNYKATVTVTVVSYEKKVEKIDLLDSEVTMNVGENRWFLYKTFPEDAVVPKLKVEYKLLRGTKTAPITIKNNAIYLEAMAAGEYEITLALDAKPEIKDTCTVHAKSMVTGIEISDKELSVFIGEKKQLTGNALPDSAIIKGIVWKSSNTKIASVNPTTGEVLGVSKGDCIITATTIDGGLEKECKVTVDNPVNVESLEIRDSKGNIIGEKPEEITSSIKETISIIIDGVPLVTDQPPIMYKDRVLAPVRAIFESLGAAIYWNSELKTATGILNNNVIQLTINNTNANVNGQAVNLDVPAKLVNNRTMVPVRFIAENLGVTVNWDASSHTVTITTK